MGAKRIWQPLLLLAITSMVLANIAGTQENNNTTGSGALVSSSTTEASPSSTTDDVDIAVDLSQAARVEELNLDLDPSKRAAHCEHSKEAIKYGNTDSLTRTTTKSPRTKETYDVIDALAEKYAAAAAAARDAAANNDAAGVAVVDAADAAAEYPSNARTGQTTRIFTTGEVNDDFWLKHLGDDFKHAIHLQVGSNNEDYNRIINQTNNGVHRVEVHHEYLPGAERPQPVQEAAEYDQPPLPPQVNLVHESPVYKQPNVKQQDSYAPSKPQYTVHSHEQAHPHPAHTVHTCPHHEQQHTAYTQPPPQVTPKPAGYAQYPHKTVQPKAPYTVISHSQAQAEAHSSHTVHTCPHHESQHTAPAPQPAAHTQYPQKTASKPRVPLRKIYKQPIESASSYISSSEDVPHADQAQATSTAAKVSSCSAASRLDSRLPFKTAFNEYGSRPTRDLAYWLYKRGL